MLNESEKKELEWLIGVCGQESGTTDPVKRKDSIANYEKLVRLKLDSEKQEAELKEKEAKIDLERDKLNADIEDKTRKIESDTEKSLRQARVDSMKTALGAVLQGAVIVGSLWQVARVTKFTETNYLDSKPLSYGVSLVRDGFRKFM